MPSTRRSHRKSRKGCDECKRRHIRCDQRQPGCVNCELAERACSFPLPKTNDRRHDPDASGALRSRSDASRSNPRDVSREAATAHAPVVPSTVDQPSDHRSLAPTLPSRRSMLTPDSLPSATGAGSVPYERPSPVPSTPPLDVHHVPAVCCPGISDDAPTADFSLHHMILLQHTGAVPDLIGPERNTVDIALRHAPHAPYLLDEVLAFTAFHLTSLYPGSAVHLSRLATELQTRALASFTRLTERATHNDQTTAVPRFLFSAILGRHVLSETLTHCRSDFNVFVDRFVACLDLNRGIRAVVPSARDALADSEVQPFLRTILAAERKIVAPGNECDALSRLLDASDLNAASVAACRQAVRALQRSFDLCRHLDAAEYPQAAVAFAVALGPGFTEVLRKQRPEALAVLASYGVVLHRCRTVWAFREAGAPMIRAIAARLGSYWQGALAWPLHVLATEA